jgi:hypothetical protein
MGRADRRRRRFRGITLIDVLVVLVLIGLLVALWVPVAGRTRERERRNRCANNLRIIGNALQNYRGLNQSWPRVIYAPGAKPDVSGVGADAPDPFRLGGPPPNNVPAALFLLLRTQELDSSFMICPAAEGRFTPDRFNDNEDGPASRSNFSDVSKNLGYSFLVTYTEWGGRGGGPSGQVVAADLNPGTSTQAYAIAPAKQPTSFRAGKVVPPPAPKVAVEELRRQSSNNHGKRGQMVLFDDGSVDWFITPFAGFNTDNIYSTQKGTVVDTPIGEEDAILLPAEK